jgi:large subunit ribosomal protein L23
MGLFSKKITADKNKTEEKNKKTDKEDKKISMKELYGEKKVKSGQEDGKKEMKTRKFGNAYKVLIRPLITEKASIFGAENKYFFEVSIKANKIETAKAIEEIYGVKPLKINIIKNKGKKVRYGRTLGERKDWKKAIITLPEGASIKIYEGV